MEKINFINGETSINDTNLNQMQDNMENAINTITTEIEENIPSVIDNLESTSTTEALSAKQGKIMNEKITETEEKIPNVIDNLESTSTTEALSAKQGKTLNDKIAELTPVELYSGSSNGTEITLNDNISNYEYVEVMYCLGSTSGNCKSSKGIVGKTINLSGAVSGYFENSYYGIRIFATNCSISEKTLTKANGYVQDLKTDGTMKFRDTINGVYITRVVGYKE